MSNSVLPTFSSKSFMVSGFTFKSLIHFASAPLPEQRVPRPAPLPVAAGPDIRCPPALGSAAVMLSRSRCASRAFSRSLSAFQKVRSDRAGTPGG